MPFVSENRACFVIYVYGDDGADEKRERVVSVSVVAGYENWWQELEAKWIARCGGIPFHATDCESDKGDYAKFPHKDNKERYWDLATILAQSKVGGVGIAMDIEAQRKTFPHSLGLGYAYYRVFLEAMINCAELGKNIKEIAKLTFDISTENAYNAALLYKTMRDGDPLLLEWLHPEISFIPWKDSARVQVGDLLAYEAWKVLDHTVGPVKRHRGSWEALRATGRFETLSYGEGWFSDLKGHIDSGRLAAKVNVTQADYEQWLRNNKQEHNVSNMIRFVDAMRRRDEQQGVQKLPRDNDAPNEGSAQRDQGQVGCGEDREKAEEI